MEKAQSTNTKNTIQSSKKQEWNAPQVLKIAAAREVGGKTTGTSETDSLPPSYGPS